RCPRGLVLWLRARQASVGAPPGAALPPRHSRRHQEVDAAMSKGFALPIEPIARCLLGEPNRALSSANELRYGTRGSLAIDLANGTWFDHETNTGGGTLDLVTRQTGFDGKERTKWLRENGFEEAPRGNGAHHDGPPLGRIVATYDYVDEAGALISQAVR